jgi:predicted ATPase
VLDEPEAALSPLRQMSMLRRMHDLVRQGCQFIVATHAPILLAYPDALIYQLDEHGRRQTDRSARFAQGGRAEPRSRNGLPGRLTYRAALRGGARG